MLVFRAGSPNPKAVPLSLVTRLEEIDARTIEMSSGRPLVQYRGQLMPLVPVNDEVRIKTSGTQPLLVFSDDERSMGLVVDEIVDIVEDRLDIEVASEQARPHRLGGDQGPGDRDHRHRAFPAAGIRGLAQLEGARREPRRRAACS